jgi:hypothetical protein
MQHLNIGAEEKFTWTIIGQRFPTQEGRGLVQNDKKLYSVI